MLHIFYRICVMKKSELKTQIYLTSSRKTSPVWIGLNAVQFVNAFTYITAISFCSVLHSYCNPTARLLFISKWLKNNILTATWKGTFNRSKLLVVYICCIYGGMTTFILQNRKEDVLKFLSTILSKQWQHWVLVTFIVLCCRECCIDDIFL